MNIKYTLILISLLLLIFLPQCKVVEQSQKPEWLAKTLLPSEEIFKSFADSVCLDYELAGISIAVVEGIQPKMKVASGFADKENEVPMNTNHVLLNGSIGKTYVAALLFSLMEEGVLALNDLVGKFLDHYKDFDRIPNASVLTIDHLMSHTSGIPRYVMDPKLWDFVTTDPMKVWTPEERLSYILDMEPVHPAGDGWGYSDTNYILLGMVIEKITGQPYFTVLQNRIIEPHGLKNTYVNDRPKIPELSAAYSGLSQLFNVKPKVSNLGSYTFNPQIEWTGGGISTTPTDLATWTYRLHSGLVISKTSYQSMTSPAKADKQFPDGSKYGRGCILREKDGSKFYGHSGIMPGFLSFTEYNVKGKYAIAIQVNIDRLPTGKSLKEIAEGIYKLIDKANS